MEAMKTVFGPDILQGILISLFFLCGLIVFIWALNKELKARNKSKNRKRTTEFYRLNRNN